MQWPVPFKDNAFMVDNKEKRMKQKDAVYQAMVSVVGHFEGKCEPSKEQRAQVALILVAGFGAGTIDLDREYDEVGLKTYVSGLMSNWLRKDDRLNGGVAYVPKNPGSRTGASDPSIVAMRALLEKTEGIADRAEIQTFITKRLGEIKPAHAVKTINPDDLPAELRAKYIAGK